MLVSRYYRGNWQRDGRVINFQCWEKYLEQSDVFLSYYALDNRAVQKPCALWIKALLSPAELSARVSWSTQADSWYQELREVSVRVLPTTGSVLESNPPVGLTTRASLSIPDGLWCQELSEVKVRAPAVAGSVVENNPLVGLSAWASSSNQAGSWCQELSKDGVRAQPRQHHSRAWGLLSSSISEILVDGGKYAILPKVETYLLMHQTCMEY